MGRECAPASEGAEESTRFSAAAIKLGMDETQLEKWQAENDSLLRPTQRREYKAK